MIKRPGLPLGVQPDGTVFSHVNSDTPDPIAGEEEGGGASEPAPPNYLPAWTTQQSSPPKGWRAFLSPTERCKSGL